MLSTPRPSLSAIALAVVLQAGPIAAVALLMPSAAHAQAMVAPIVDLVGGMEAVGDGATPVILQFVAVGTDGKPLTGVQGKMLASEGKVDRLTEVGGGRYTASWTPAAVSANTDVQLTFRGKAGDKQVTEQWTARVIAPRAAKMEVATAPNRVVLGESASATVTFNVTSTAGKPISDADLAILASSGTVANLTPLGDGKYRALYTPPNKQYPHLDLITVVDRRDPSRSYGAATLPLVGKAAFPVVGQPNSMVMLRIGDSEFGPVQADGAGRAQVPIVVPPGIPTATVISVLAGKKTEEAMDLQLPTVSRAAMFPLPSSLPSDGKTSVPVRGYVAGATGGPDVGARVTFSATAGSIGAARHEGGGIYVADFVPPLGTAASQVTLTITADGTAGKQTDTTTVDLIPARPSNLTITTEPAGLAQSATGFQAFVRVVGADGSGLPGKRLSFVASGATLKGEVKDLGNGDYQATFSTTGSGPVELVASVKTAASANPVASVIAFPSQSRLANDGVASTMLTIATVDAYGLPVPNVPVSMRITRGDGSLPAAVTTDESGIANVPYTSGRAASLVNLQVEAEGHIGSASLLQVPAGVATDLALTPSGSTASTALLTSWRNVVRGLRVERTGMEGASVKALTLTSTGTAGPVARITSAAEPATVGPGGSITLKIQALDAEGRGAAGKTFEVITNMGTISAISDQGGGNYIATLSVPAGSAGEAKVSIMTPDGGVSSLVKVPVAGTSAWSTPVVATAAATPTTTAATPATTASVVPPTTEPAVSKPPKAPKEPRAAGAYPWLRLRGGYEGGLYSYNQEPLTTNGPLYTEAISFGGGTSSPAGTAGLALSARAFLPGMDWLGGQIGLRTGYYSVEIAEFDEPVPDWVTDFEALVVARYPFVVGSTQLHVGGRAGLGANDFVVYKLEQENGTPFLTYEPLAIPSLDLGAEIGADFGTKAFLVAGITAGLANASDYYSTEVDFAGGYNFYKGLLGYVNLGVSTRDSTVWVIPEDTDVDRREVGTLKDGLTMFGVGIGYQR
jgi:Bacterial Ig-like domain (group 1)